MFEYIKWLDITSAGDEWVEESEVHDLCEIETVGILLKETDSYITLCLSLSEDRLIRGYVTIPKSVITSRKVLHHG